jgi:primosomal protein N'
MTGAGGGNFDVTMWLGNVWLYATDTGKPLRSILETSGERPMYKIVKDNIGSDPENVKFVADLLRSGRLNQGQKKAIQCSLKAKHFALIQGFPGSGKTHLVVALIQILLKLGRRVLITAHTHSAVDNLLIRVLDKIDSRLQQRTVRLGNESSMR